jgi:predicted HTH domain antitoxin
VASPLYHHGALFSSVVAGGYAHEQLLQFGLGQDDIQHRLLEWLVLSLFTEGRISSGKAARLLNITRIEFLTLLRSRGIAYINYTSDELADEFASVKKLQVQL